MAKYQWAKQQDNGNWVAVNRVHPPTEGHTMWLLYLMNKNSEWGYVAQAYEKQHLVEYVYKDLSDLELVKIKCNPTCANVLINGQRYFFVFKQDGPLKGYLVPSGVHDKRNYVDIDLSGKDFRICTDVRQALDHAPIITQE